MTPTTVRAPVAMLVFNRPEKTARVLDAIRLARPKRLLVVADGPRPSRPEEASRCAQVRALFDRIDWPCEIERDFADENLGCRRRIASGLDWVFARAEEAIVLEDDCLPDASFFPYCDALLERYREEPRVMAITGDNFHGQRRYGAASYYFSRYMHVWGWASWRRAWRRYDVTLSSWPAQRRTSWLVDTVGSRAAARYWTPILDKTHAGSIDTWDYQWTYAIWAERGLVATPNVNLVSNIGVGPDATHTVAGGPPVEFPVGRMEFPLTHPASLLADEAADRAEQEAMLKSTLRGRVERLIDRLSRTGNRPYGSTIR